MKSAHIDHSLLGIAFLALSVVTFVRIKNHLKILGSQTGSGRIITIFYILIACTALLRGVWLQFLVSSASDRKDLKYTVLSVAFIDHHWLFALFTFIIKAFGTICLYSIFLIVLCFWSYIVKRIHRRLQSHQNNGVKLESEVNTSSNFDNFISGYGDDTDIQSNITTHPNESCTPYTEDTFLHSIRTDPMPSFFTICVAIFISELANFLLFLSQLFNIGDCIAFDSILSVIMSICAIYVIHFYHKKLQSLKALNGSSLDLGLFTEISCCGFKCESITLFSLASIAFFTFRCLIDFSFGLSMLLYITSKYHECFHFVSLL
jgi:hypothetical protein